MSARLDIFRIQRGGARQTCRLAAAVALLWLIAGCAADSTTESEPPAVESETAGNASALFLYSWIDGLSVRDQPSLDAEVIGRVPQGGRVEADSGLCSLVNAPATGCSSRPTIVRLRSEWFRDHWIRVRTSDGTEGWVHQAGLRTIPVAPASGRDPASTPAVARYSVTVEGKEPAPEGCSGGIDLASSHDLDYTSSIGFLRIFVEGTDPTLVVKTPDGRLLCADDSYGRQPALDFQSPQVGRYQIWPGVFSRGRRETVRLVITEDRSVRPR